MVPTWLAPRLRATQPLPRGLWSHWYHPRNAISAAWSVDLATYPSLWGLTWRWHHPWARLRGKDDSTLPDVSLLGWAVQRRAYGILTVALEGLDRATWPADTSERLHRQLAAPCAPLWEPDASIQRTPVGWLVSECVHTWGAKGPPRTSAGSRWNLEEAEAEALRLLVKLTPHASLVRAQPDGSPSVCERMRKWSDVPWVCAALPTLAAQWASEALVRSLPPGAPSRLVARL